LVSIFIKGDVKREGGGRVAGFLERGGGGGETQDAGVCSLYRDPRLKLKRPKQTEI